MYDVCKYLYVFVRIIKSCVTSARCYRHHRSRGRARRVCWSDPLLWPTSSKAYCEFRQPVALQIPSLHLDFIDIYLLIKDPAYMQWFSNSSTSHCIWSLRSTLTCSRTSSSASLSTMYVAYSDDKTYIHTCMSVTTFKKWK